MPGGPAMEAGFPTARSWAFGFWCGVRPMLVGRFPLPLSATRIHQGLHSRNLEHPRLFRQVKDLLGGQPLVFDREFSDLGLFEALEASGIQDGIRLNGAHRPTIPDEEGRRVA
jgi:hypothetical protein